MSQPNLLKQYAPLFSNSFYYSLNFFLTPSGPFVFLPFFLSLTAGLIKALYSLCPSEQSNNRERVSRMSTTTSPHINSDYDHAWHLKQYNLCPQYSLVNALHFCISSQYRKKTFREWDLQGQPTLFTMDWSCLPSQLLKKLLLGVRREHYNDRHCLLQKYKEVQCMNCCIEIEMNVPRGLCFNCQATSQLNVVIIMQTLLWRTQRMNSQPASGCQDLLLEVTKFT